MILSSHESGLTWRTCGRLTGCCIRPRGLPHSR
jgi:hypothetical protein